MLVIVVPFEGNAFHRDVVEVDASLIAEHRISAALSVALSRLIKIVEP